MKLAGVELSGPSIERCVLMRNGHPITFTFQAVIDESEFENKYPRPKPPILYGDGKGKRPDYKDEDYVKEIDDWARNKKNWTFLQSISATEGLEWETVDKDDPDTFGNFENELKAHFTPYQIQQLHLAHMTVQGFNLVKVGEAMESFLQEVEAEAE